MIIHNFSSRLVLAAFCFGAPISTRAAPVVLNTVIVGNPGNANDTQLGGVGYYGGVDYVYNIGRTEVTNAQYAAFLTEKAKSDPLDLYSTNMGSDPRGGITRSGASGSFTYATRVNMGNKPVNFVSLFDSMRFANWINNGQGAGDTETGSYTLLGGTPTPSQHENIVRNASAAWFVTGQDEWYKAAYHQPWKAGGDVDDYWAFPTRSNSEPTYAFASKVGDITNPGPNVANSTRGAEWNGQIGNLTTVGSAGPASESYYGTADQGGNVFEWNDTIYGPLLGSMRGGGWNSAKYHMASDTEFGEHPPNEFNDLGFRVARTALPGDANFDGFVDGADYVAWADHFLQTAQPWSHGDFTGETKVDGADYTVWADHFAPGPFLSLSAVPEPSTLALAGIGALALIAYSHRRIRP